MYTAALPRFTPMTITKIKSYVYALADDEDQIFYVGKGAGNRVFDHVNEVQAKLLENPKAIEQLNDDDREDDAPDDPTSKGHLGDKQHRIGMMLLSDKLPSMYILRDSLDPTQALIIESVLISVLDWQLDRGLTNLAAGHGTKRSGLKTVHELEATSGEPFNVMDLPGAEAMLGRFVMAININRRWADVEAGATLLEVSEGHWKVNRERAEKCQYAIVHARGIVRGVLVIARWSKSPLYAGRSVFQAVGASQLVGNAFANKNASSLFGIAGAGSQNPIRYVQIVASVPATNPVSRSQVDWGAPNAWNAGTGVREDDAK